MQSRRTVRTAILAIASLALVVVCYAIYQASQLATPAITPPPRAASVPEAPTPTPATAEVATESTDSEIRVGRERVPLRGGEGVTQTIYDNDGNVRAQIDVDVWRPIGEAGDEFEVQGLAIRFHTGGGQLVYLSGDTGRIKLKSTDVSQFDPKSGRLKGNVHIVVHRIKNGSGDADTGDAATSEQIVELNTDELMFDLEYGRVQTDSPFTVESSEFSIAATGLSVSYNELANRVDELTITKGERIEVRSDELKSAFSLAPDGGEDDARAEIELAESAPTEEEPEKAERAKPDVPEDGIPLLAMDEEKDDEKPAEPSPNDVYTASFDGDVDVAQYSGEERLGQLIADRLIVMFDFGHMEKVATQRGARAVAPTDADTTGEAVPAPADDEVASTGKLLLTWTGGLRVTSQRDQLMREPGAPQRVHITAVGNPVQADDGERIVTCRRLVYHRETQLTQLFGADGQPAHAEADELGSITGLEVVLDRTTGRIFAKGPGGRLVIRRAASERLPGAQQPPSSEGPDVSIGFDGEFVAKFETEPSEEETKGSKSPILTSARFDGNVDMMHGSERIQCDRIEIDFEAGENGTPNPTRAQAIGNVLATQGWREISASRYMDVAFCIVEKPKPPFDQRVARQMAIERGKDPDTLDWDAIRAEYEAKKEYRPGLKKLTAAGEVRVLDPQRNVEISCETLECDFKNGRELASGLVTPEAGQSAYVALGKFSIASGKAIPFDVDEQFATVDGTGRMTFLTEQNLDGSTRSEPSLVSVKWTDRMTFDGNENKAVFVGAVRVESEKSTYDCDTLRVDFVNAPTPEPPQNGSASSRWWILAPVIDRATRRGDREESFAITGPAFNKEPVYVYASGGVKSLHRNADAESGRLKSRVRIGGPTMAVDLRQAYITVQGAGDMLIEDYTLSPAAAGAGGASNDPRRVSPFGRSMRNDPSQTYLAWEESMTYRYKLNVADLQRNVSVAHRTGDKMVRAEEFLGEALDADMRSRSREATLNCQSLVVEFVRDEQPATTRAGAVGGANEVVARAGQLAGDPVGTIAARGVKTLRGGRGTNDGAARLSGYDVSAFNASGQVHFFDSGISAIAEQITYTREDNVLQIQGTTDAPAQLFDQRKRFSEMRGPKFVWDRSTNKIWGSKPTARMR